MRQISHSKNYNKILTLLCNTAKTSGYGTKYLRALVSRVFISQELPITNKLFHQTPRLEFTPIQI